MRGDWLFRQGAKDVTDREKVEQVGNRAAEEGDPDWMEMAGAALDGDVLCWSQCLEIWEELQKEKFLLDVRQEQCSVVVEWPHGR